jgi:hypothetical protein
MTNTNNEFRSGLHLSKTSDTLTNRIKEFVKYFVVEFESKLYVYKNILEGKTEKGGKFSDIFSNPTGQLAGGAVGFAVGFSFGVPVQVAALGSKIGKLGAEKLGSKLGTKHHMKKVINVSHLVHLSQNEKANFRKVLVNVGVYIFQCFEMQFMRVSTDQGWEIAMQRLAIDATNRVINYYSKEKETDEVLVFSLITEGVFFGESKIESFWGGACSKF